MKPIPKNIKAAKKLIEKYREITIEDMNLNIPVKYLANTLTGFGSYQTCTLCTNTLPWNTLTPSNLKRQIACDLCIYYVNENHRPAVMYCTDHITYQNIVNARTKKQLLKAFKERADYIEKILIDNNWKNEQ